MGSMGQRNKQRRAAKARARRRERSGSARPRSNGQAWSGSTGQGWSGSSGQGWSASGERVIELATAELLSASAAHAGGDALAAAHCAEELVRGPLGAQLRRVDAAADMVVRRVVRGTADGGWLPVDLYQVARRRLEPLAATYVVDAIAGAAEEQASLDARWSDQLDEVDAETWWSPDRPHLSQWASRHRCGRAEALCVVIEVLALLGSLPLLAHVPPAPRARTHGVDEKMLARVRGLLAKAESTEFPEEAEALSAKAQDLMSRYSLHKAMAEHDRGDTRHPTSRRIWLDSPYVSAKAMLVDVVSEANRCRAVFSEHWGFITVLGDEVDLDIVELLTTSLLVQATHAMMAAGRQVDHRSRVSRTRSFRQSFLVAYATRIGQRLKAAAQAQVQATDSSRLLPVLAARTQAVDELFSTMFPSLYSKSVSVSNAAGWGAGLAAAELARLDVMEAVGAAPA